MYNLLNNIYKYEWVFQNRSNILLSRNYNKASTVGVAQRNATTILQLKELFLFQDIFRTILIYYYLHLLK